MKYYLNIFSVFICKIIGNMLDIIFCKFNIMQVFFKKNNDNICNFKTLHDII